MTNAEQETLQELQAVLDKEFGEGLEIVPRKTPKGFKPAPCLAGSRDTIREYAPSDGRVKYFEQYRTDHYLVFVREKKKTRQEPWQVRISLKPKTVLRRQG